MKIQTGDIFSIKTKKGYGFIQYVESIETFGEYVRILSPVKEEKNISQSEINQMERWSIYFPLKIAHRRKIIDFIGKYELPSNYVAHENTRIEHNIRGEHLGWRIVSRKTLAAEFKKKLDAKDLKLSPHGIFNDTLIIEYLESDWKLENWK